MSSTANKDHWSRWWQQGHITTFGSLMADNYAGAIHEYWCDVFSQLPESAAILDIASGNGAVACLAATRGADKNWRVCGTDLADIDPEINSMDKELLAYRAQVEFHSNTPCERQPFPAGSFDLVTSQYGFEYSEIVDTLIEIARVLRPGGQFVAVSHHIASDLLRAPRQTIRVINFGLEELALFDHLGKHFGLLGRIRSQRQLDKFLAKPRSRRHLIKVEQGLGELARKYPADETGARLFCRVEDLLRDASFVEADQRVDLLDTARNDFDANRQRLMDMVAAGLSEQAVEALMELAHSAGFEKCGYQPFREQDGTLVGWTIQLQRS